MKKLSVIISIGVMCLSGSLWAQNPVPDPDTISNPIQQGDPAVETLPPRMDYIEDKKRITAEEVPDPVKETLESDAQYRGWEEANIFHDQNTDEYLVEFQETREPTTYRFNKDGAPILEK